jgi:hypothetical protein
MAKSCVTIIRLHSENHIPEIFTKDMFVVLFFEKKSLSCHPMYCHRLICGDCCPSVTCTVEGNDPLAHYNLALCMLAGAGMGSEKKKSRNRSNSQAK